MLNQHHISRLEHIHDFDHLEIIAKFVVEGFITGLHKSPYHGFSVEFAEHRQYNTGESTRNVDWKLYARTDRLYVKKFEEETNLRSYLAIDTSGSMLFPYQSSEKANKLAFSVISAAALIHLLRNQRDAVGLMLFNEKIELLTNAKISTLHAQYLFGKLKETLHTDYRNKESNIAEALHYLAENVQKRSLIIVFSDMFYYQQEELFAALQHLRFRKHEVLLFHTYDSKLEQQLQYSNRPYKFIDIETQQEIKINPNEIRENYRKKAQEYKQLLETKCSQYQIDYIEADVNKEFHQVLLPYLVKRSKLY